MPPPPEKVGGGQNLPSPLDLKKYLKNQIYALKWLKSDEKIRGSKFLPPPLIFIHCQKIRGHHFLTVYKNKGASLFDTFALLDGS